MDILQKKLNEINSEIDHVKQFIPNDNLLVEYDNLRKLGKLIIQQASVLKEIYLLKNKK